MIARAQALFGVVLAALVICLGAPGLSKASEIRPGLNPATSSRALDEQTVARAQARSHPVVTHRHHGRTSAHYRHHTRWRQHYARAQTHRRGGAHLAKLSPARHPERTVRAARSSGCVDRGDLTTCRDVMQAEHTLILANREAVAEGVPIAVLRVGLDHWFDIRRQAAARSHQDLIGAYETRMAFVDKAVASTPDWRAIYPPIREIAPEAVAS